MKPTDQIARSAHFSLPPSPDPHPRAFDALEVHTVAESLDPDLCTYFCEQIPAGEAFSDDPDEFRVYWSLYGHTPNEGSDCIGDFNSFESACEFARRLGGIPA